MPKKVTLQDFIEKANKIHHDKYDYSKTRYTTAKSLCYIICPHHGSFWQSPSNHLQGKGCPKCVGKNKDTQSFIEKAKKVHNGYYVYDKVEYRKNKEKVIITCPDHGDFKQSPEMHLSGQGCPECGKIKNGDAKRSNKQEFVQKALEVHGDVYDYTQVDYLTALKKVCIICSKHGEFWQRPSKHLLGQGCPKCKSSHLETEIRLFLNSNDINFIEQANNKHLPWLGLQSLDFYLPGCNIGIECQGKQHFLENCNFGSSNKKDQLQTIVKMDQLKLMKCQENGITLLYYSNLGIEYPYKVYEDKEELLQEILKHKKVVEN